jgi:hypothetical protein
MTKKKRKRTSDLPTDKAIRRLFPKEVVKKADEVAHEKDEDEKAIHDRDSLPGD